MKSKSTHYDSVIDDRHLLPRWVVMEVKPNTSNLTNKERHCNLNEVTLEQHEKRRNNMILQNFCQEYYTKDNSNSIMSTMIGESAVNRSSVCFTDGLREATQDRHKGTGVTIYSEAEIDLPSFERDVVNPQNYYYLVRLCTNLLADLECEGTSIDLKDTYENGVINQATEEIRNNHDIKERYISKGDYPLIDVFSGESCHDDISWHDSIYSEDDLYNRKIIATLSSVGGTGLEYQYGQRTVKSRGVATDERSRQ